MAAPSSAPSAARSGRTWIADVFGADPRSLAALRIVLAIIVLADLVGRAPDLSAFYTDDGVLPRDDLRRSLDPWQLSLNMIDGGRGFQTALFAVCVGAAVAMLIGYRTRLVTVIVWVLVLSIQWRNPLVLSAGDTLLRLLLFWGMFLPLGAVWSVDRVRVGGSPRWAIPVVSVATVGLFLQIAFMYWFSVILKSGDKWRVDGDALYFALSLEQFATPFGDYMRQFDSLLRALTFTTLVIEAFGPVFLFWPVVRGPIRTGAVMMFVALHIGILLTMDLGIFSWLGASCMVAFLPSWFWEHAFPTTGAARPRAATLASDFVRDAPAPAALWRSRAMNGVAGACLAFVLFWNLTTVVDRRQPSVTEHLGNLLGLKQRWDMFAPQPAAATGWYVIAGTLRDGREVDLMRPVVGGDFQRAANVSWDRPGDIAGTYNDSKYWRKYFDDLRPVSATTYRQSFAVYACRQWNEVHDDSSDLVVLQIVYLRESTLPGGRRGAPVRDGLSLHACRGSSPATSAANPHREDPRRSLL